MGWGDCRAGWGGREEDVWIDMGLYIRCSQKMELGLFRRRVARKYDLAASMYFDLYADTRLEVTGLRCFTAHRYPQSGAAPENNGYMIPLIRPSHPSSLSSPSHVHGHMQIRLPNSHDVQNRSRRDQLDIRIFPLLCRPQKPLK